MKLSIIIPVYNEKSTISEILKKVSEVDLAGMEKEIIVVDDFSTDGTREILKKLEKRFRIFYHDKNYGKGMALRTGFNNATGDFIIMQDADLEYDPGEYPIILRPLIEDRADVVYGSRFMGDRPHRVLFFWHYVGNRLLTTFSNMITNLTLTDMETGYKAFKKEVIFSFKDKLVSERFGIEPELTARIAGGRWRVYEVGISYYGRNYSEGKKISWRDGLAAVWQIIKFNLLK